LLKLYKTVAEATALYGRGRWTLINHLEKVIRYSSW